MKTITLTVVVDENQPMAEQVVRGAIRGILPSVRRVASSWRVVWDDTRDEGEK
jgi:hypothetical protein